MMVSFQRKRLRLENLDELSLLAKNSTVHNLSAPHKWGPRNYELIEENYALLIPGPMERNQGVE